MYNFKGEKLGCTKTRYGWICEIGAVQKVCLEQIYATNIWGVIKKLRNKNGYFWFKKTVYCANVHILCFMQELGKSELKVKYLLKELVQNFILKVVPSPLKILLSNEN